MKNRLFRVFWGFIALIFLVCSTSGTRVAAAISSAVATDQWIQVMANGSGGGVIVSPLNPQKVFATGYQGVWRSLDGGSTWSLASNGLPTPYDTQALWMARDNDNILYVSHFNYGWYRSMDGGDSWQQIFASPPGSVPGWSAFSLSNHDVLYMHTYSALYRTTNATSNNPTWQTLNCGGRVTAVDPTNADIAYFVGNVLLKTTDGGQSCFQVSAIPFSEVRTEYGNGGRLYGFTQNPWGFYSSDNGGATWTQRNGVGFPTGQDIWGFTIDPNDRNHLLASATSFGVRESKDGGDNWNAINNGYPAGVERSVTIGFDNPPTYYATTNNDGVWQYHPSVRTTLFSQPHANYMIVKFGTYVDCDYASQLCLGRPNYHTGIDSVDRSVPFRSVPILAAAPGIVAKIQRNGPLPCTYRQGNCLDHGVGNTVILQHKLVTGKTIYTQYSHLHEILPGLNEGSCVPQGSRIGLMGGTAYGKEIEVIHLHFEVKDHALIGAPDGELFWGYTPKYPDIYGYHDPKLYVGIEKAVVIC